MPSTRSQKLIKKIATTKAAVRTVWFDKKSKLLILFLTACFIIFNAIVLELFQIGRLLFASPKVFIEGIFVTLANMQIIAGVMMIILSLLSALLIAMVMYALRIKKSISINKNTKASAGAGILLTLLAPACPSCGIGVLSALGLTTLGAFLPFSGHEFGLIGIIVLCAGIIYTAPQIQEPSCKI